MLLIWIEGALALELALVACEGMMPWTHRFLPISGSTFGQAGGLLILAIAFAKLTEVLAKMSNKAEKNGKKRNLKSKNKTYE
jgi:hypothetical protein